jgi:AspT/YidE/YbjL antiporter-like protein
MGQKIRDAAIAAEAEFSQASALAPDESYVLNKLAVRVHRVNKSAYETVGDLESGGCAPPITVEKIKRKHSFLHISPDLKLQTGDLLLLVGQRDAFVKISECVGPEVSAPADMNLVMKKREVVVTNQAGPAFTLSELRSKMLGQIRHGVYVLSVTRGGHEIPLAGESLIQYGDIVKLYGLEKEISEAAGVFGVPIIPSAKTDMLLTGVGIVLGLLLGMLTLNISGIPLTLGSGGGALISGLFVGWFKGRYPQLGGTIPSSASELMKDFGLAGFVSIVGLDSGLQAFSTIRAHGVSILFAGLIVTLIPLLICMLIGRYLLGYKNTSVFAGALSGARSANPAFGEILEKSANSVPTVPFAVTYALANVFLTLLGPLVVALV